MKLSSLKEIVLDIDSPIEMHTSIEFNKLSIMVGPNNTGKTFCLVNVFCFQTLLKTLWDIPSDIHNNISNNILAQQIFDSCFDDQNINGSIEAIWDNGTSVKLTFVKGDVTNVTHTDLSIITDIAPVMYMSSHMRTFDAIKMYLKMRKMMKEKIQPDNSLSIELLGKLLEHFKLYDIVYLETILSRCPFKPNKHRLDTMKEMFEGFFTDIKEIDVNYDKCDFVITRSNDDQVYASTLSKGDQSLLNMSLIHLANN
jgi:hypothetical protein